jgi:hydrogenase-4 component B
MALLLAAIVLAAVSGVPGLVLGRRSSLGPWVAAVLSVAGGGLGIAGTLLALGPDADREFRVPWSVPGGELHVGVDGLSAVFLLPVFLIGLLGSVYGLGYWKQAEHPDNGRKLRLFYGLMTAAMALVVVARNTVLFLVAWEVMALAGFFLVTTEDEERPVREAGWLYLAATHVATLCLFALFALLRGANGSFALVPPPDGAISPGLAAAVFLLAVAGFGLKAGLMPLHVWLPGAHASAPSHVSALMSGVLLKMGVYGLVRITSLFPHPPLWWGGLLLTLGVVSAVLGVVFALAQHDLKRLLAYHSIENIGIIVMGLGLALAGRALGQPAWALLGLGGALLHVWNHALFKSLLFYSAGSVVHATHTREIDHLGGLGKEMPYTALAFLIGAVAICGLPPLNGFVSEWLVYLGLFRTLGTDGSPSWDAAAFAAPALALVGALAVACFVKVYGIVFLGTARSEHAAGAHESGPALLLPMGVLALGCVVIGLAPVLVAPLLEDAVAAWMPLPNDPELTLTALAPLGWVSVSGGILIGLVAAGAVLLQRLAPVKETARTVTWDCGYAAPTPRMQYTASSFAQMLVGLFGGVLRPREQRPRVEGPFPSPQAFHSETPDLVLDGAMLPAARSLAWLASWSRVFQQGSIQAYLFYLLAILIALLLWP